MKQKSFVTGTLFMVFITLVIFIAFSCKKEEHELIEPIADQNIIDQNINELSILIAKASANNIELRKIIKHEIEKKFDYDYDALLLTFIGKNINGAKFEELLSQQSEGRYTSESIIEMIKISGFLQISMPVNFDQYDPSLCSPLVVAIPTYATDENSVEFIAYDNHGYSQKISAKTTPTIPVLVVMKSERVNEKGKIIVDPIGFYLQEEDRIDYVTAIKEANERLLLKSSNSNKPLVEVVSQEQYDATPKIDLSLNENSVDLLNVNNNFKAEADVMLKATAKYSNTVELQWKQMAGATKYKIYRNGYKNVNGNMTWFPDLLIFEGSNTYTKSDLVDYNNQEYSYYVSYYKGTTFLGQSNICAIHSSHRKNNGLEYVAKITATKDMVTKLEGWWVSELEIRTQIAYINYEGNEFHNPEVGFVIPTHGKGNKRDVQWNGEISLFTWDRQNYEYGSYTIVLEEVDNADNHNDKAKIWFDWVHFILDNTVYKEVFDKIEKTISILDEPDYIGSMRIKWWDPNDFLQQINTKGFSIIINHKAI